LQRFGEIEYANVAQAFDGAAFEESTEVGKD